MMHIFITGGTGLVGSALIRTLMAQGQNSVTVLTRNVKKAAKKLGNGVHYCTSLESKESLDEYDVVINLAGESLAKKYWSDSQKEKLCKSRWDITRKLVKLIGAGDNPPKVFISGSAVGFYGAHDDEILTETSYPKNDFTYRLCSRWEALALMAASSKTRVCISRTGIVMSDKGGMLPLITIPFRIGFGSAMGDGRQYISWIHIQDMVNAILFMINTPEAKGVFNLTAPNPVTNRRFSRILARTLYRPCILRIPAFMIKTVLGEVSTTVIEGQRVIPKRLLDLHFRFLYEHLDDALVNVLLEKEAAPRTTEAVHQTR